MLIKCYLNANFVKSDSAKALATVATFWRAGAKIQYVLTTEEGTLGRILGPNRAVYHILTSQGGQFSVFCQARGHFSASFGSQEGTLARVLPMCSDSI